MSWTVGRLLCALVASGLLAASASCSLLTEVDGLAGGDAAGAEGGTSGNVEGGADGPAPGDSGPLPAKVYADAVLADGPIAYFHLDETSGPTARSVMGQVTGTYHGTFAFGAESAVGAGGTSVTFDGTSSRLDFGDVFAFPGTAAYSLECWFKPSATGDTRFLFNRTTTASPIEGYAAYFGTSFLLFARETNGAELAYASTDAVTKIGAWMHVVVTYNGTVTELYVDGVSVGRNLGATTPIGGGPGLFVLGDNANGQFNKLAGQIDEFAVYDRGLTAAQVLAHFQAAKH